MPARGRPKRTNPVAKEYMRKIYEPITPEYLGKMDDKYNGGVSFYTATILDFLENMWNAYKRPVHQNRLGNRRANFYHYGINLSSYLDYLHDTKRLVQVLLPSGSLLYFPAKVLDTMSNEEILGAALEAEDEMRFKQREAIREAALERAERTRMRKAVTSGRPVRSTPSIYDPRPTYESRAEHEQAEPSAEAEVEPTDT